MGYARTVMLRPLSPTRERTLRPPALPKPHSHEAAGNGASATTLVPVASTSSTDVAFLVQADDRIRILKRRSAGIGATYRSIHQALFGFR